MLTSFQKNLFTAVKNGDFTTVNRLLNNYYDDINILDEEGKTLLHYAVQKNDTNITKALLDYRSIKNFSILLFQTLPMVKIEIKDKQNKTAYDLANNENKKLLVEYAKNIVQLIYQSSVPDTQTNLISLTPTIIHQTNFWSSDDYEKLFKNKSNQYATKNFSLLEAIVLNKQYDIAKILFEAWYPISERTYSERIIIVLFSVALEEQQYINNRYSRYESRLTLLTFILKTHRHKLGKKISFLTDLTLDYQLDKIEQRSGQKEPLLNMTLAIMEQLGNLETNSLSTKDRSNNFAIKLISHLFIEACQQLIASKDDKEKNKILQLIKWCVINIPFERHGLYSAQLDINYQEPDNKNTALHLLSNATIQNEDTQITEALQYLISNGANFEIKNAQGEYPACIEHYIPKLADMINEWYKNPNAPRTEEKKIVIQHYLNNFPSVSDYFLQKQNIDPNYLTFWNKKTTIASLADDIFQTKSKNLKSFSYSIDFFYSTLQTFYQERAILAISTGNVTDLELVMCCVEQLERKEKEKTNISATESKVISTETVSQGDTNETPSKPTLSSASKNVLNGLTPNGEKRTLDWQPPLKNQQIIRLMPQHCLSNFQDKDGNTLAHLIMQSSHSLGTKRKLLAKITYDGTKLNNKGYLAINYLKPTEIELIAYLLYPSPLTILHANAKIPKDLWSAFKPHFDLALFEVHLELSKLAQDNKHNINLTEFKQLDRLKRLLITRGASHEGACLIALRKQDARSLQSLLLDQTNEEIITWANNPLKTLSGHTPYTWAIAHDCPALLYILLSYAEDLTADQRILIGNTIAGDVPNQIKLKPLQNNNTYIVCKLTSEQQALFAAAKTENTADFIVLLNQYKGDLNITDEKGNTLLHYTVQDKDSTEMTQALLDKKTFVLLSMRSVLAVKIEVENHQRQTAKDLATAENKNLLNKHVDTIVKILETEIDLRGSHSVSDEVIKSLLSIAPNSINNHKLNYYHFHNNAFTQKEHATPFDLLYYNNKGYTIGSYISATDFFEAEYPDTKQQTDSEKQILTLFSLSKNIKGALLELRKKQTSRLTTLTAFIKYDNFNINIISHVPEKQQKIFMECFFLDLCQEIVSNQDKKSKDECFTLIKWCIEEKNVNVNCEYPTSKISALEIFENSKNDKTITECIDYLKQKGATNPFSYTNKSHVTLFQKISANTKDPRKENYNVTRENNHQL